MAGNETSVKIDSPDSDRLVKRLWWVSGVSGVAIAAVLAPYVIRFGGPLSPETAVWGQFGDYLGGVLNPVFGFLGLVALLLTIVIQSRALRVSQQELANSTEELRNSANALAAQNESLRMQSFEAAFFQLLRFHNDIVNDIDIRAHSADAAATTLGRDCFRVFYDRLRRRYGETKKDLNRAYAEFYKEHEGDLGHYFRHLYEVVDFVDSADLANRARYVALLGAQLSSFELLLLFYHGVSSRGTEKMRPLIERYSLLANLTRGDLLDSGHPSLFAPAAFGALAEPIGTGQSAT